MDGDRKETQWDDVLRDGLLRDVLLAQDRANRALPPEPEDEFLIGRRQQSQGPRPATSTDAACVVAVGLVGLSLMACMCYMSVMGGGL